MKKILLRNIGIGLLMIVLFNIVLFIISLIFSFEAAEAGGPTLLPAIVFAGLMGLFVCLLVRKLKPASIKESLTYSISWSLIVFGAILIITIANDTVSIFFGKWFNYIVFLTMAISPILLKNQKYI